MLIKLLKLLIRKLRERDYFLNRKIKILNMQISILELELEKKDAEKEAWKEKYLKEVRLWEAYKLKRQREFWNA